jgi:hypothetical protein
MLKRIPLLFLLVSLLSTTILRAQGNKEEAFTKAKFSVTEGDKTKQVDVTIKLDSNSFLLLDAKNTKTLKTIPLKDVKSVEYSYAKSPRWKTGLLISPVFLFTPGKKHWLNVQGNGDYALIQLDKSNYKLILAAVEAKSGKKVETVTDKK